MKVVKPQRISVLQRVFEHRRRYTLAIGAIVYRPLADARGLLAEQALWNDVAEHVPGGVLDEASPKVRGECLVSGSAYAVGSPSGAVKVNLVVSRGGLTLLDKRLAVWGNRHWKSETSASEPVPFDAQPMDWSNAFGGDGFQRNPSGKGFVPSVTEDGEVWPLPNVEYVDKLVTRRDDRPEPAGLGGYDVSWPQRMDHLGTKYDEEWLRTAFPGPASDFDPSFFNVAPRDQQIEGFFHGTETLVVEGMHPTKRRLETQLSPLVVRMFVTQRDGDGASFREVPTRLDTLHVFPHLERIALVYRGTLAVAEDDGEDIEHLLLAAEAPTHPRSADYYQGILRKRLDREAGALASLKDEDLLPPVSEGWSVTPDYGDFVELTRNEQRLLKNMERGRREKLAGTRAALEAAGFSVEAQFSGAEPPPPPDPYDTDAVLRELEGVEAASAEREATAKAKRAALEVEARQEFERAGMDYDTTMATAERSGGGPPNFSADDHLGMLHDMARIAREGGAPLESLEQDLVDPGYEKTVRDLETRVREAYARTAHLATPARVDEGERATLRVRVAAAKEAGEPLSHANLTGADLQDLDLRGMNLAGALLEGANLAGADLTAANLAGAVLARANLTRTKLVDADLRTANLGGSTLLETDFSGANLEDAMLMRAELDGPIFHGSDLSGVDFIEAQFTRVDFSHARAERATFLQADLRNASFVGAQFPGAIFMQANVSNVDFTGAELSRAQFVQTAGDGAIFNSATLADAVLVHETSLHRAEFASADLSRANLRKTPLRECNFAGARLDGACLMGCDVGDASLERASARGAMLIRTDFRGANLRGADLLGALMSRAKLQGADLSGANVSRADLSLVQTDGATRVANLFSLDTRVDPKHDDSKRSV